MHVASPIAIYPSKMSNLPDLLREARLVAELWLVNNNNLLHKTRGKLTLQNHMLVMTPVSNLILQKLHTHKIPEESNCVAQTPPPASEKLLE